jgi:hypothetical protein
MSQRLRLLEYGKIVNTFANIHTHVLALEAPLSLAAQIKISRSNKKLISLKTLLIVQLRKLVNELV